jgi:hypothetical protein
MKAPSWVRLYTFRLYTILDLCPVQAERSGSAVALARRMDENVAPLLRHAFVWLLATFSAAGGMVQGYAIGLASGLSASSTFDSAFPDLLHKHGSPMFVVVFVLGAAGGSSPPIAGLATVALGRKATIVCGAIISVIAGVFMAATPAGNVSWLCSMRALSGISVGLISVAVPLYQSEIAPVHLRGKLMATFQLGVTLGILCVHACTPTTEPPLRTRRRARMQPQAAQVAHQGPNIPITPPFFSVAGVHS